MNDYAHIGRSVQRKEGRAKVTGAALFTDDLKIEGLLHGATVRSRVPRGRITGIHFEEGFPWEEFIIVTARDIPGKNAVAHLMLDQPCLADGVINHAEEPILLLAHPGPYLRADARERCGGGGGPARGARTWTSPWLASGIVGGKDNIFKDHPDREGGSRRRRGPRRPTCAWTATYRTGAQEHVYIETNGMRRVRDGAAGVWCGAPCSAPTTCTRPSPSCSGLPGERVRVLQMETGRSLRRQGGLPVDHRRARGPAGLEGRAAGDHRLRPGGGHGLHHQAPPLPQPPAHRLRRPGPAAGHGDGIPAGRRRLHHPSPVVLSRGAIHALGPYRCPNVRIQRPGGGHQHPAQRRLPGLRRAPEPVRHRAPHGRGRRPPGPGPGATCGGSTCSSWGTSWPPGSG